MAGTFESEDQIHPTPWNPQGGTASTRSTGRMELDHSFLIQDTEQHDNGVIVYRTHAVLGWDAYHQLFTKHVFSGDHGSSWGSGDWDGERLIFDNTIRTQYRYIYTFPRDGYRFVIETRVGDGIWHPYLTSLYHRVD
jgi:hypothetical protein